MIKVNLLQPGKKEIAFAAPGAEIPAELEGRGVRYDIAILVSVIFIALIGWLYYSANSELNRLQEEIAIKQQEKQKLQGVLKELEENKKKKELLTQKTKVIEDLIAKQLIPVKLMDLLSKSLPDQVWLTRMKFSGNRVEIEGKALTNTLIATFISNLEDTGFFRNVDLISSKKAKGGRGVEIYVFKLRSYLSVGTQSSGGKK